MASRRADSFLGSVVLAGIAVVTLGSAMWEGAKAHPVFVFVAICIVGFGFVGVFALVQWAKRNALKVAGRKCLELAKEHQRALLAKKRQNFIVGDYGEIQRAGFDRELDYFLATVVLPQIQPQLTILGDQHLIGPSRTMLRDLIEKEIREFERVSGYKLTDNLPADPLEFERWCMEKLKSKGWKARVTKASGDQGADIIASWNGVELVAQCKLYSKPVGNKAVQEVAAARVHYAAEFAAVISASGYTKSARQLATTNDVLLVDATELEMLDTYLEFPQLKGVARA